jgi:hypothetical protein
MKRAEQLVRPLGENMYAYTDIPELYLRQGWRIYKPEDNSGNTTVILDLGRGENE